MRITTAEAAVASAGFSPRRLSGISGFVLAGGPSRRMGSPKAGLMLDGEPMICRQVRLLDRLCGRVAVTGVPIGNQRASDAIREALSRLDVRVIPDQRPGCGPLGGILSGLCESQTEWNLFLACDLPFVPVSFLRYLCRQAFESSAEVTVPESRDGHCQPLCGVYRRSARLAIRRNLDRGEKKVTRFFGSVNCRVVSWAQIAKAGFPAGIFANMNTPEDYEAAIRRLSPIHIR